MPNPRRRSNVNVVHGIRQKAVRGDATQEDALGGDTQIRTGSGVTSRAAMPSCWR